MAASAMSPTCFANLNLTCIPGASISNNSDFATFKFGTCCCAFGSCVLPPGESIYTRDGKFLLFLLFLLVICLLLFMIVCKGIRYEFQNIPFFMVNLIYQAPEHIQWVDPWRDTSTLEKEERGYFKTRAALEIYVKKKYKKTSSDLEEYWHNHPETAGGIHIPAWFEGCFSRTFTPFIVLIIHLLLFPIILGYGIIDRIDSHGGSYPFCDEDLEDHFYMFGIFPLVLGLISLYYMFKAWKHNNWQVGIPMVISGFIALFSFNIIFGVDVLEKPVAQLPRNVRYRDIALWFYGWDLALTITRVFLISGHGLDLDLPRMIKRFRGKHESSDVAPKVWIVSGCPRDGSRMDEANGEYFRSPALHYEHGIAWSRVVKQKRSGRPRVGDSVEIRFGEGVRRRTMMGKVIRSSRSKKTLSASFGVELGASDDAPVYIKLDWTARPGRQVFSFKIMRVATKALRNQPHWVLVDNRQGQCIGGLGGQVRYAARDMSNRALDEPPSSGWHSMSENRSRLSQQTPSVLAWDAAHYTIDKDAEKKQTIRASLNTRIMWGLSILWLVLLVWFISKSSDDYHCEDKRDHLNVVYVVLMLVWVEFATHLMVGVGLTISPAKMSFFHIFVRLTLIWSTPRWWFIAASLIYLVFMCRVGWWWAQSVYPAKTVREVLKEHLRGALPQWMFSGVKGGGDEDGSDQFVQSSLLKKQAFSPLIRLAKTFDCLLWCVTGARGQKSCAGRCSSFLESALFVLTYFTVPFVGVLISVYKYTKKLGENGFCEKETCPNQAIEHFPRLAFVKQPGIETNNIEQWEIGLLALALSACVISFARAHNAYNYYGHKINSMPPRVAIYESGAMFVAFFTTAVIIWNLYDLKFLSFLFLLAPLFIFIFAWTVRNWEAMDYTLLFKRTAIKKSAFKSPMKTLGGTFWKNGSNLRNAAGGEQARLFWRGVWERAPTIVGMLLGPVGCSLLLGWLLEANTDNELFPHYLSWSIPALLNIFLATTMILKVYFRNFTIQWVLLLAFLVWVWIFSYHLGFGNESTCFSLSNIHGEQKIPGKYRPMPKHRGDIICNHPYNTLDLNIPEPVSLKNHTAVVGRNCMGNSSVCLTPYDSAVCLDWSSTSDDVLSKSCRCKTIVPYVWWLKFYVPKYFGKNCEFISDGYSMGLSASTISQLYWMYLVVICYIVGIYSWSLFSFRYQALVPKIKMSRIKICGKKLSCRIPTQIKGVVLWFILADIIMTIALAVLMVFRDDSGVINVAGFTFQLNILFFVYFFVFQIGSMILYYYVSSGFRCPSFPRRIRKQSYQFVGVLLVLSLIILYINSSVFDSEFIMFLLIVLGWMYFLPSVLRVSFGSSDHIHFPETLFPIFHVDRATDQMMRDDSSSKNVFYIIIMTVVYACVQKIAYNKNDSSVPELLYFCSMCCVSFFSSFLL